ncbi:MAG: hypothetical protein R2939_07085 [Kofleriaceae bacterium]
MFATRPHPLLAWTLGLAAASACGSGSDLADARQVDLDTILDRAPAADTQELDATFEFHATEEATFMCAFDDEEPAPCTSPLVRPLPEGAHTFSVTAQTLDGIPQVEPTTHAWRIDITPPETAFATTPANLTRSSTFDFTFTSDEPGVTFECSLDGAAWVPCADLLGTVLADGSHTVLVRGVDAAGNIDPTPAEFTWTIDSTPPETSVTAAPRAIGNQPTSTFEFGPAEAGTTFMCSLDGAAFEPCTSPLVVGPLADGDHTLVVVATDAAGNVDPTPLTYTWTVDTVPPDAALVDGPPALTGEATATIELAADEAGTTFTCVLDGGAPAACSSPVEVGPLADGEHTLVVTATDAAGNVDPTPLTVTWTVDTHAPDTSLDAAPAGVVGPSAVSFEFSSAEPGATFWCAVDGGAAAACTSPHAVPGLATGAHAFAVAARTPAGVFDPTPATATVTVDATPPVVSFSQQPGDPDEDDTPTFAFAADEAATFSCVLDGGAATPCTSPLTTAALANGDHALAVTATDPYGNVGSATVTWLLDVVGWTQVTPPAPPAPALGLGAEMAYDAARGELILLESNAVAGTSATWSWDGTNWALKSPPTSPPSRSSPGMAYDAAREEIVLFGGYPGSPIGFDPALADTWVWDGVTWTERFPATVPPTRAVQPMVYDPVREEILMFGGRITAYNTYRNDTWVWDGTNWTLRSPSTPPAARYAAVMDFDRVNGSALLFGGYGAAGYLNDTWRWDGMQWTKLTPATSPSQRWTPEMVYDEARGELVLFGGFYYPTSTYLNDTWRWSGTNWVLAAPPTSFTPRYGMAADYDPARQEIVQYTGTSATGAAAGTWTWDGTTWTDRHPTASPPGLQLAAIAADTTRDELVLFGGKETVAARSSVWLWDGGRWTKREPLVAPASRFGAGLAFDADRAETILFGGTDNSSLLGDTWSWDGTSWLGLTPLTAPDARAHVAMAWDAARGEAILFGGETAAGKVDETWRWDGATWIQAAPLAQPSPRTRAAIAWDPARAEVVLFGGATDAGASDETWIWDGTTWTARSSVATPSARAGAVLAYDPDRSALILFGGTDDLGHTQDTWIWDGTAWTARSPLASPSSRSDAVMAFDHAGGAPLMFGGIGDGGPLAETWTVD